MPVEGQTLENQSLTEMPQLLSLWQQLVQAPEETGAKRTTRIGTTENFGGVLQSGPRPEEVQSYESPRAAPEDR